MAKKKLPERVYKKPIREDLNHKMVFISGPRQVGKTTLALQFIDKYKDGHPAYLNWDRAEDRSRINKEQWPKEEPLVIFDEIHKRRGWQTLIKGIWDKWKNTQRFIITGSSRLDVFRKGGDSMLGRYHSYRVHPFSLPELGISAKNLKDLFRFGGFPEPLLMKSDKEHRRWILQRIAKIVRIDLRDLQSINQLDKVEILAETLPSRIGSILSYRSIGEDLEVSDKTIKNWIKTLESLYFCYLIYPNANAKIKAIKKSPKLYLWDWSQIEEEGPRFENMVASHLLKYCHFIQDTEGHRMDLQFIRSQLGQEVDFVVLKNRKALFAVEAKLSDKELSPSLKQIHAKMPNIPFWYQVSLSGKTKIHEPNLVTLSFENFCKKLKLV